MPRENANGARAKSGGRTVPVGPELIRLYADYLHEEYGGVDSDHVFVNIWAGPKGHAWSYRAAYDLVLRLRARTGIAFDPSLNYASRVARLGCRTRSRSLHGYSRAAAAEVENRQRGKAGQVVEHRMSGFCGDQAGDMAATAWRSGCFGHSDDRLRGRLAVLSCGNVRQFSQQAPLVPAQRGHALAARPRPDRGRVHASWPFLGSSHVLGLRAFDR